MLMEEEAVDWGAETAGPDEEALRLNALAQLRRERIEAWNVERNNTSGHRFELSDDGFRTATLKSEHAGKWYSMCSDVSFETGVHFISVRVSYHGASPCASTSLSPAWMLGVASKNCPLDKDPHSGGQAFDKVAVCAGIDSRDVRQGAFWSLLYRNHRISPYQDGQIVASPPSIVNGLKHGEVLKHKGTVHHGDVIGIRADLDKQTVTFFVNGERIRKSVQCQVGGEGWTVLLSASTPSVKFTIMTNLDPDQAPSPDLVAPWEVQEQAELEDAAMSGAKALCHFERAEETNLLREALITRDPKRTVRHLVEGGAFSQASWAKGLSALHSLQAFRTLLEIQSPLTADAVAVATAPSPGKKGKKQAADKADDAPLQEHPLVRKAKEQRAMLQEVEAEKLAAAHEARAAKDALEQARGCLSELRNAERLFESLDISLRMQNADEEQRLKKLVGECEAVCSDAVKFKKAEAERYRAEVRAAAKLERRVIEMREHTNSILFRLHTPISDHLRAITSPQPTFSAADEQTGESNQQRRDLGAKVAVNECVHPRRDEATGALSVVVCCNGLPSDKIRIHYTTDGKNPTTKSPSIANGKTISITSSCTVKAIAVKNMLEPSSVSISPYYVVRSSEPEFKSSGTSGKNRIRV